MENLEHGTKLSIMAHQKYQINHSRKLDMVKVISQTRSSSWQKRIQVTGIKKPQTYIFRLSDPWPLFWWCWLSLSWCLTWHWLEYAKLFPQSPVASSMKPVSCEPFSATELWLGTYGDWLFNAESPAESAAVKTPSATSEKPLEPLATWCEVTDPRSSSAISSACRRCCCSDAISDVPSLAAASALRTVLRACLSCCLNSSFSLL